MIQTPASLKPSSAQYQSIDSASRRRRSHPATTVANKGAPRHMAAAAAVINWPATATDTERDPLMSLSVPGTIMTPVPMTKLPNSRAQRTFGIGGATGCEGVSVMVHSAVRKATRVSSG